MADGFQTLPTPEADAIKRRSFSVAELDAMFDAQILSREEKIELIDGEILQMNSQMLRHGVIKMRILKALLKQLPEQFDASNEITVQLSDTTLVDPDVLVTSKLDADIRYVRRDELFLAIEVAHTSIAYDLGVKAQNYAHAAIQELWVVDVNNELTWVHRLPSETGYRSVISVEFGEPLTPLISDDVKIVIGSL